MARVLHRLGLFAARRKWVVLGVWIVGIAPLIAFAHGFGSNTSNNLQLPGTDSQAASDLSRRVSRRSRTAATRSSSTRRPARSPTRKKQAIEAAYKRLKTLPHVASVVDPFSQQGAPQISKDKKTAFIPVLLDVGGAELTQEIAESVLRAGDRA